MRGIHITTNYRIYKVNNMVVYSNIFLKKQQRIERIMN